jgi:GT2 family glycosyltransferase/ADP-heptose:LPS heptosyltransferase
MTRKCLAALRKSTKDHSLLRIIITDNASTDDTADVIDAFEWPDKIILTHPANLGFGAAHNEALKHAGECEFFLCLNNDLFIQDTKWIEKATAPLKDAGCGLVGIAGTPTTLDREGRGSCGKLVDYVEGSFVLGRTALFQRYGLFSEVYKRFWFEDSDLSLRFRQLGYGLAHADIKYHHEDHASIDTIDLRSVHKVFTRNKETFLIRWAKYLKTRSFHQRILLKIPSIGIGDILSATPAVAGVMADHPGAETHIQTNFPALFEGWNVITHPMTANLGEDFDRIINMNPNYSLSQPLAAAYCGIARTVRNDLAPIFRSIGKLPPELKGMLYVACNFFTHRADWHGRNWNREQARGLVAWLKQQGYLVVEVGQDIESTGLADVDYIGATTLKELAAIIEDSAFFVGIDSLPLHIAQAVGARTYALFGATNPLARITNHLNTFAITNKETSCIFCYHRKGSPGLNRCDRGDQQCMQELDYRYVYEIIRKTY